MDATVPFTLGEDHLAFQQSVRTLARSRYADSMLARSQSEKFPTAEFGELGAAGLLGLLISESAGGQGATCSLSASRSRNLHTPTPRSPTWRSRRTSAMLCSPHTAATTFATAGSPAVSPARPSSASR